MTLLDWIDTVPPLTMGQFLVIVVPLISAQTLVTAIVMLADRTARRQLPATAGKGGPD